MKVCNLSFKGNPFKRCYITDDAEAGICIKKLQSSPSKKFGLDLETAKHKDFINYENPLKGKRKIGPQPGLCPLLSEIRLCQIYDPLSRICYVFDFFYVDKELLRDFFYAKEFVAHYAVFEIKHLTHNGFPDLVVDCTKIMAMMIDVAEHSPFEDEEETDDLFSYNKKAGFSLGALVSQYLKVKISKEEQVSDWNDINLSKSQIDYAALDAVLTYELGVILSKKLLDYKMGKAYKMMRQVQHSVARMELCGIPIDQKAHDKLIKSWELKEQQLLQQSRKYFGDINLNSNKQLNEWVITFFKKQPSVLDRWEKTSGSKAKDAKPSTSFSFGKDKVLLASDHEALKILVEYKKNKKLLSSYGNELKKHIHPLTKRLHTSFSIAETRTGRFSSRSPNLQNGPHTDEFRSIFKAPHGWEFVIADFSQIEIRVAAIISNDPVMLKAYREELDLHVQIVEKILGIDFSKLTKEQYKEKRQFGKGINFGLMFGMRPKKLLVYLWNNYKVKVTIEQSTRIWKVYHSLMYKIYSQWCDKQRLNCERTGVVITPMGRVRKLLPAEIYTKGVNTPIQGGAGEVAFATLNTLLPKLDHKNILLANVIHDDNMLLARTEYVDHAKEILSQSMHDGLDFVFKGKKNLPHLKLVDVHSGSTWAEAKG